MMDNPKAEIERILERIVGTPFWGSARAADMEMFAFGRMMESIDRQGRGVMMGEFALHVQCPWHLERSGSIITGSRDLYVPASGSDQDDEFDWETYRSNRRDVLLEQFFAESSTRVDRVEAGAAGILAIFLSGDSRLRIFPDRSVGGVEHWRFLEPSSREPHLVVTSDGVTHE